MFATIQQPDSAAATEQAAERLSRKAYMAIRQALKTGELRPGQKLILRPMAAKLGLSATPVREALLRLVSEQALGLDGRNSVLVPSLSQAELLELKELRFDLEGRAAAVTATRSSATEIDEMAAIQDRHRAAAAAGDVRAMIEADEALHLSVRRCSGKTMLLHLADTLQVRLGPLVALACSNGPLPTGADHPHDRMIEAFRNRDADAARAAMVADIEAMFASINAFLTAKQAA